MAVFVLVLVSLLSAGILAKQPPLAMKFRQGNSDLSYRRTTGALSKHISVEIHEDDNVFAREIQPDLVANEMTVKTEVQSNNEVSDGTDSGCDFPFVRVGTSCYFFSSEQKNFADAEDYCETLTHGHGYEVTLAMMAYARNEDQALMDSVTERGDTFWLGATTEDGVNWSWLDERPLSLQIPLWDWGEPNAPVNKCLVAQPRSYGNNIRSFIYDSQCTDSFNFICQTRFPLNFEFRKIGNDYYFLSEEVGLPPAHWQDARDYCTGLLMPVGYHSDLAVLNMTQQDDYTLMSSFFPDDATGTNYAWIGAFTEDDDCTYKYIDNRTLPITSTYWEFDQPTCGTAKFIALRYYVPYNRVFLYDFSESSTWPFICQMFKTV